MKFIIAFLLLINIFTTKILAVDATPSADQNKVQDIINALKQNPAVQQVIKEKLNLINSPSTKPKSFIGTIVQINDQQISINYQNNSQTILIDSNVAYFDIKHNKSKLTNFKIGQDILAMGYLDQNNQLTAKRIVAIDLKTLENKNQVINGKIVDISQSSPIMVIIPIQNKNTQYQIKTDSNTLIFDQNNNKITSKNITVGQKIIAIIQPDLKITKTFDVSKIINLDFKISSPSATPTTKQ